MADPNLDQPVRKHIEHLVKEEHRLHSEKSLAEPDLKRLKAVQVELDQCWDLLRQRRALRETGHDASEAHVRPPEVVEKYKG